MGGYEHEPTGILICENKFSKSTRLTVSPDQTGKSTMYTDDKPSFITFTQLLKLEGTVFSYCGGGCVFTFFFLPGEDDFLKTIFLVHTAW